MFYLVAADAKRQPVVNVKRQFGKVFPGLDVMGVQLLGGPTTLTSVIVTQQDGAAPMLVPPEPAVVSRGGAFVFTARKISALAAAIFDGKMSRRWAKPIPAAFAFQDCFCAVSAGVFALTTVRAGDGLKVDPPIESFATDDTNSSVARGAIVASRVVDGEQVSTTLTRSLHRKRLFHDCIIPRNGIVRNVQRWADMTGQEPVLLDAVRTV